MKQNIISRKHVNIFWITLAVVALTSLVLYSYAHYIPSAVSGAQSRECEGALNTLAELERNPTEAGASESKLKDARQLAETECAKKM